MRSIDEVYDLVHRIFEMQLAALPLDTEVHRLRVELAAAIDKIKLLERQIQTLTPVYQPMPNYGPIPQVWPTTTTTTLTYDEKVKEAIRKLTEG